ncbi:hypothetical protein PVAND_004891 [Polypedilum vanderplanki]|uniref:Alpha-N-acetylglucosaminidase n=1 Tax=Polypedilum vanderplanki TaxID=319348 RepID=A0A9J6BZF3_POLVA|nr:hypothetical protein PVAND_004891 [Polypedilum vanderplanki]
MKHTIFIIVSLLFFTINSITCKLDNEDDELARIIRPITDEKTQQQAALNVIRRLIHERADNVAIKVNFKLPVNYFKIRKTNNSEMLRIEASSGVAATKAFHYYLKHFCGVHISWDGHQLKTLEQLDEFPAVNIEVEASSKIVYYQNVCTHSYSYSFWKFEQWREHIDFIALSGITLTLAPFQEDVWTEIYREYGMTQDEIDEHLAGVGFFAWQRMGNIRGWGGKLSKNFIEFASNLQQQIITALNELGISVAIQAFDGHLPIHFKTIFPNASFSSTTQWNDFPPQYCCPLFIEPIDPLFREIGEKFLRAMIQRYGTNHIYFSDPFNEVQPRISDANYLRNVSLSIYSGMQAVDSNAIWLLQGWFLVNNPDFWNDEITKAFLTAVPHNKLLILDLQSEQHPQYNRTSSFYGQKFIWCMLHNFGGTLGMHGSIRLMNVEIPRAANMENSSMIGVGITPEGIHQNYVVYEFALEKAWDYQEINHKKWIKNYARNRYGLVSHETTSIEHAWLLLLKSVYAFEGLQNIRGKYVYCRRPSLRIQVWRWYDEKLVIKALGKFLAINESDLLNDHLYERDLVDLTRQLLQIQAEFIYTTLVETFKKKDLRKFAIASEMFLELLRDLDSLLATHDDFLLGKFLEDAKAMALDDDERKQLEFNARNQITLWGPDGQILDYATKQWNGIVMDYYLPRWTLFIQQLNISLQTNIAFNQSKFQQDVFNQVEYPFNENNAKFYPSKANGNVVNKAKELFHKWKRITFN